MKKISELNLIKNKNISSSSFKSIYFNQTFLSLWETNTEQEKSYHLEFFSSIKA